ncbi:MAG: hypothetical protein K1Y02_02795 [Candidatus Hydrogenedentes bacterium]|nr:hypothetical protein [Candidatus Hydrogenedentota bacterium]
MSTITAPGSREWEYTYNGMGQPVTVDAPNGIRTVYSRKRHGGHRGSRAIW